ncbi:hypothetical protein D8Y22_02360 [Salinadaptatus halalkaliphilus]|uniref:Uncharacterized protein n=1 Tax=Salinadaptatus halalkaliphilus TaxID=2419781 RepID=A0A4S3TPW7_9EURY|nr:hypothetical protein [Salinadaptatus halalkaliphilus]THE66424.1 hypothetical protein D8Y22_02360 [Salinadaptatus halalkaliphilus]
MSSPSPETETHEVSLSTEEQWVVHYALGTHIDDALDDGETPPEWTLEVFDAIEDADETETFTRRQTRRLVELLDTYLETEEAPYRDIVHGTNVQERLEETLDARA